jgi:hypothetical protein
MSDGLLLPRDWVVRLDGLTLDTEGDVAGFEVGPGTPRSPAVIRVNSQNIPSAL